MSTNLVPGSGPSAASTSSSTPSTMVRVRSTSPPKSAWPGVSTMLILRALVEDGGVLRQDRDAALALEVVAVQHARGQRLVLMEDAGLAQHVVDQGGLAVVNVGDDRDVADVGLDGGLRRHTFLGAIAGALCRCVLSDKNTPQADARGACQVGSCEACIQYSRTLPYSDAVIVGANRPYLDGDKIAQHR